MVVIRETVRCAGSSPAVFDYVADFTHTQEWDPGVASAARLTPGNDIGVGTEYDVVTVFKDKRSPMRFKTIEYLSPTRVVLEGTGDLVHTLDTICFTPDPQDPARFTIVEYSADIRLSGCMSCFTFLLRGTLTQIGKDAMAGLVKACASRAESKT